MVLAENAAKAREELGWAPRMGFAELVRTMVDHDLELARRERVLLESGRAAELIAVGS